MKFRAFQKYPFTIDVYDFTIENDANGTLNYSYKETIDVAFYIDPDAPRVTILSETPLRKRTQLLGLRDKNGVAVMPGAQYTVTRVDPIITVAGTSEGYRMQAALANDPTFVGE